MKKEFKKRLVTSIFLLTLLTLMFFYTFFLIIFIIIIAVIAWFEFYVLVSKILKKNNINNIILKFIYKSISLFYLSILVIFIISIQLFYLELSIFIFYPILISIMSDVGGLIIGRKFKGKKLTKISPKKTISGAIGSLFFSILLVPFFLDYLFINKFLTLLFITILISIISQCGDIFISYLKRKANVKDTSNLLPGHGGLLDRIDGIIFTIPIGFYLLKNFSL